MLSFSEKDCSKCDAQTFGHGWRKCSIERYYHKWLEYIFRLFLIQSSVFFRVGLFVFSIRFTVLILYPTFAAASHCAVQMKNYWSCSQGHHKAKKTVKLGFPFSIFKQVMLAFVTSMRDKHDSPFFLNPLNHNTILYMKWPWENMAFPITWTKIKTDKCPKYIFFSPH